MSKRRASKDNGGVNKSQAIRDALSKNPDASPKELSAELTTQGVKVSPTFVSMIKFKMKAGRKGPRKARATRVTTVGFSLNDLVETKKLVDRVGGIEKAQSLLGTLSKLL